jgi:hypothetical protein
MQSIEIPTKQSPIKQITLLDKSILSNGRLLRGACNATRNDIT